MSFILLIINMEMITKKFLNPKNLLKTQVFCIDKTIKIIVIYKDKSFMLIIFLIIMLSFEYFNNRKKFIIMNFISYFY